MSEINFKKVHVKFLQELQLRTNQTCSGCNKGCDPVDFVKRGEGLNIFVDFSIAGTHAGERQTCEVIYQNYFPGDEEWWSYLHREVNFLG